MRIRWESDELVFNYQVESDMDDLVLMLAKESVTKTMFFGPNTPEQTHGYFDRVVKGIADAIEKDELPKVPSFTIRAKDGNYIGECALEPLPFHPGSYIVGVQTDDGHWRKGYGTTACEFLIFYAFSVLDARRLNGDCQSNNPNSRKMMEKCGFNYEGTRRKFHSKKGKEFDQLVFGLLAEDITEDRMRILNDRFE